jgi:hypothetical protein
VDEKHFMSDDELEKERKLARDRAAKLEEETRGKNGGLPNDASHPVFVFLAWSAVGVPLAYAMWIVMQKALVLFQ